MNFNKTLMTVVSLCALSVLPAEAKDVVWYDGAHAVTYYLAPRVEPVVKVAADMFAGDMLAVTGRKAQTASAAQATIKVIELPRASAAQRREMAKAGVPIDSLRTKIDGFAINVADGRIWVVGANGRGCAYGLLELSRKAGVSPWVWWGDVVPARRNRLVIDEYFATLQGASVEYRGIFINDEDWSIRPWSYLNNDPSPFGQIGTATYRRIFHLLLRLRANALWPAMHERTKAFFTIPGARALADSCSIALGSSHCEALLRNNVGEWDHDKRGEYNYITNSDNVRKYWAERLEEIKDMHGGSMLTIGMRGVHDGTMAGVHTMPEKLEALQRVIDDQQQLIARHIGDPKRQTQIFIPYKEVLDIYRQGLKVPDYVTLMWCDDNYGYMTRLSDKREQQRSGGGGIYYHLSYWGQPHDYLWLTTTQPGLIYNEMRTAYDHNVRKVWIANVHDPKVAGYDLELFLDMAWNIDCVTASTLERHYEAWLCRQFGDKVGKALLPAMKEYYRLCAQRRPEFMGWSQCENFDGLYDWGLTPVRYTQFNAKAFGNELDRYLNHYAAVAGKVKALGSQVAPELRDAYFAAIEYPVCAADAHARKMLWAQKARLYAGDYPLAAWQDTLAPLYRAVAESQYAYRQIIDLTRHYNEGMAHGKWCHSMTMRPRNLPVFGAPVLPFTLTDREVEQWRVRGAAAACPIDADGAIGHNACDYQSASPGVQTIQMLGHSMKAVAIPADGSVEYDLTTATAGDAVLRIALIPTQPNDDGDLRFSVSIDGGQAEVVSLREPFRSAQWKENVLRQQVVKTIALPRLAAGKHHIVIKALDPHVILDQWMVDYNRNREFYLFPVAEERQ